MKKFLVTAITAVILSLAVGSPPVAVAQDNAPGEPGAGGSGCVYCKRTFLYLQQTYNATCEITSVNVGYGYRSCRVVSSLSGNQDCVLSNFGACGVSSGGGGGGFIA